MHTSENTPLFQEPIGFGVTYLFPRTKKASKTWRQNASGWTVEGFGNSKVFDSGAIAVDSPAKFFDFLDKASRKPCFLIRGQLRPGIAPDGVRRTLYAKGEAPAYFEEVPRRFVAIDADKVTVPGADVFNDPEYVADYVRGMLPAEFQDVACFVQLSSSAGMSPTGQTLSDVVSLRLWFCTEQAYSSDQLRRWAAAVNNKLGLRLLDPVLCNAIQAHYIAAPTFLDAKGAALPDILPRRCFVLDGIEDRIEALEIPAVAPRVERLPGEGGSFDGADVQACLDRIGDDQAGYQLPILHACIAAVRSKGKDLDDAAFIRSVQAAVLTANHGARSQAEIDRYSAPGFTADKLKWAHETVKPDAVADAEQAASILANATPAVEHTETQAEIVSRERAAMCERFGRLGRQVSQLETMRAQLDAAKGAAHAELVATMAAEFERANGCAMDLAEIVKPDEYAEYKKQLRRAKGAISRQLRKEIAGKHGLGDFKPNKGFRHFVQATTGLGKTQAILAMAAELRGVSIDFMAPTYGKIEEARADFAALNSGKLIEVERGRGQPDPERRCAGKTEPGQNPELMCPRYDAVQAAAQVGVPIKTAICKVCPLFEHCGYQAQIPRLKAARAEGVIFAPHAFLKAPRKVAMGGLVIVDEDCISGMFTNHAINLSILTDHRELSKLVKMDDADALARIMDVAGLLADGLVNYRATLVDYLAAHGVDAKAIAELIKDLKAGAKDVSGIHGKLPDASIKQMAKELRDDIRHCLMAMLRAVARVLRSGAKRLLSIYTTEGLAGPVLNVKELVKPRVPPGKSVVVLDATGRLELIERAFAAKFNHIKAEVPANLDVTVVATTGSKMVLSSLSQDEKKSMVAGLEAFAGGRQAALIGQKAVIQDLAEHAPATFKLGTYGSIRGMNSFSDCDVVMTIGRTAAAADEVERMAGAMGVETGDNVVTMADYLAAHPEKRLAPWHRHDGYLNRPGADGKPINTPWHPDPVAEAFRYSITEAEIIQALGRVRAANSDQPKAAIIVCDVALPGIPVKNVIPFRQLRKGQPTAGRVATYVARELAKNRIAVLSAAALVAAAPDLFGSEGAAKKALQRESSGDIFQYILKGGLSPQDCRFGSFRLLGQQGGTPTKFVTDANPMLASVRLRNMVGAIAGIDWIDSANMSCHANKEVA